MFTIATVLVSCSFILMIYAWVNTPDIADFWHYAQPESSKNASKFEYLAGPLFFELVGLAAHQPARANTDMSYVGRH